MNTQIQQEEAEDTALRQQYGAAFNRLPSASVNGQYKQSLADYQAKLQQAVNTDNQIKKKFEENKAGFAVLSKCRAEIAAMIPKSVGSQDISQNPVVITFNKALEDIDAITKQKEQLMNQGVAMHDQLNTVEDLMKVYTK